MSLVELYAPTILGAIFLGFIPLSAQAQSAPTQSADDKIQQLEQKVDDLDQRLKVAERLKEIKTEEDADKAKSTASVTANGGPFTIRSGDGNFVLRFGLDFQIDNRTFTGYSPVTLTDQILIRRARPALSGTVYKYVDFYVRPDFGQGQTVLYEAYTELNYFSRFKLRVGKFKPPVGLERLQSDDNTTFVERGLPTLLVPSRDIGYQLSGDIVKNRVNYAVGVFNGVADNSLSDASVSDHRDYAARIFLTPFLSETKNPLSGLGVGIGATGGSVDALPLPAYKTFGQNTFVTFASGVTSAGHRTRLAPQAYYYLGPFGLLTEYTLSEEGFQKGTVRRDIALRSWQVAASYILTGEKKVFDTIVPKKAFDPKNHGWGAFELAVRVSDFNIEQGIYNYGFATAAASPRRSHEWVGGGSWYLNRMLRVEAFYGNTNFLGGATAAAGGNRPSERVFINRFQVNF
jgi:phosphate-selective porin OprO and OprP